MASHIDRAGASIPTNNASNEIAAAASRTSDWCPGQRVVNEADLSLGLGRVVRVVDQRNVEIHFGTTDEVRTYNVRTAPLRRMRLRRGQHARLRDGRRLRIDRVLRNRAGLFVYEGEGCRVSERDLDDVIPAAEAVDTLQNGPHSAPQDYALRLDGWRLRRSFADTDTRGLVGARIRPLEHQLYIAHKIAHQEVPRVLLCDEVGLGKTIEAGLIFSTLRSLGRAHRVLVVTPASLVHQWMAEMYRKFNEMFSVLSEERCNELDESEDGGPTPFESSQRAICGFEVLLSSPVRLQQATDVSWDLLIVDEAHHLRSQESGARSSSGLVRGSKGGDKTPWEHKAYDAVQRLARRASGLLLLTATPARDGLSTEFGLLHLVDPDRFSDFAQFETEREHMRQAADLAMAIKREKPLRVIAERLHRLYPDDEGLRVALCEEDRDRLLRALIDRHGTGRVFIRNRRNRLFSPQTPSPGERGLRGFPPRRLHGVPLLVSQNWPERTGVSHATAIPSEARPNDPRVPWLVDLVRSLEGEKIVLICASERIVHMLSRVFREQTALKAAVFHEGLSIVERDRQAAWFAEPDGAVILLCSEIGGEGRNFQFSHHLVLFDLPVHPDLLEQRIGRLDRVGQSNPIDIHVPYLVDTPSEALFRIHRDALRAFERPVGGAEEVMLAMQWQMESVLAAFVPSNQQHSRREALLQDLIEQTEKTLAHVRQTIEERVDVLVDLNSFDETEGRRLVDEVLARDRDGLLPDWMSRVFDRFGVLEEQIDTMGRLRIRAGDLMFVEAFPGLPDDDVGATYSRTLALAREDLQFLSQDHPIVEGALGLMLDGNEGRAAVCRWPAAGLGVILLQCLFILEASGPPALALPRYVPITTIEVVIDTVGEIRNELLSSLHGAPLHAVPPDEIARLQPLFEARVPALLDAAQAQAARIARSVVEDSVARARSLLEEQHQRLVEVRRTNPSVPQAEVERHAQKMKQTLRAIERAEVHLDAVRVIIAEP